MNDMCIYIVTQDFDFRSNLGNLFKDGCIVCSCAAVYQTRN